jgi:hypothetical protein
MKIRLTFPPIIFIAFIIILFNSCDKSEITPYNSVYDGIAFYIAGDNSETDSLSYSFAYNTEHLEKDTIYIKMRLSGEIKSYDREIGVESTKATTATENVHFDLPNIVLPAGEGFINYPLIIYNTPDLTENDYKIVLKIVPTKDLLVAPLGREIGTTTVTGTGISNSATTINIDKFTVKFNNKLTAPEYWSLLNSSYGSFSITKFQFMLKILGADAMNSVPEWSYNQTINNRIKMQNALIDYVNENGPMIDENNEVVSFG